MKHNINDKVVFKSKRNAPKIWIVEGYTNWRPNYVLLSDSKDGLLHPFHEDEVRRITIEEKSANRRLGGDL